MSASPPTTVLPTTLPTTQAREAAFAAARHTLAAFQRSQLAAKPHRAIRHVAMRPGLLLQMVALPVVLTAGLYSAHAQVYAFWRGYLLWWTQWLNMPLRPSTPLERGDQLGLVWQADPSALGAVGLSIGQGVWVGLALTVLAWGSTVFMRGHWLPIKYLVRTVCVVQALSVAYFVWAPMPFPYGVLNHVMNVLDAGYTLMLAIPVLMGLGYYTLNLGLGVKLLHTLLIGAFFMVLLPQQALVHLVVLQHLSVVFMPVLYLCFGALFDMMVFVALYAWAASKAPLSATT
ncbi:MAG: hypothetical protein ACOVO0_12115 [Burkholderiaceae bacterium]